MSSWLREVRAACRALVRKPVFTLAATLSLALGIGANAAIFTFVNELFLKPIPVAEPKELVSIYATDEQYPWLMGLSHLNWLDLKQQNEVFSDVVGFDPVEMSVSIGGRSEVIRGLMVSGNYFSALGVRAERGRTFLAEEDESPGSHAVAVVGHRYWTRRLGADPQAVGSEITINGHPFSIVGIAPTGFHGTLVGEQYDVWIPMMMYPVIKRNPKFNWYDQRRGLFVWTLGRMRPGVDFAAVGANLELLGERLEREYPDANEGRGFDAIPLLKSTVYPGDRDAYLTSSALSMTVVLLVLAISCGNVGNLFLARASERRREIAIRRAVGAGTRQVVGQALVESLLVGLGGGALGLLAATGMHRVFRSFLHSPASPFLLDLELDFRVLLFTVLLAVGCGLLLGVLPAILACRFALVPALKETSDPSWGERRRLSLRALLVAGQVVLSVVALAGAGLFLRSLGKALETDLGFEIENLLLASFDVAFQDTPQSRGEQLFATAVETVAALPGVDSATLAQGGPLDPVPSRTIFPDGEDERLIVPVNSVAPGYFETLGIPVVAGRPFTAADRGDNTPVVIVNQTLAARLWPGESALGKSLRLYRDERPAEVVGVARDATYFEVGGEAGPYLYQPLAQRYMTGVTLIARTAGEPAALLPAALRVLRELDPDLAIRGRTVAAAVDDAFWAPRMGATLLTLFGFLALSLAAIGIYGVTSYGVHRRRREIGIRMALGARPPVVLGMVLGRAMGLVGVGLAIGLAAAVGLSRLVASLLFVSPLDPVALALALLVLALVSLAASLLPARRAARIHPILALRSE